MNDAKQQYGNKDDRRRAIASAARDIILEKGFEGLRTREIAERVGINIATLHYHVPSKDALIDLVGETLKLEFFDHYAQLVPSGLSPLEELRLLMDDYKHVMLNRPELLQLMNALGHKAVISGSISTIVVEMRRHWLGLFVAVLTRGRETGAFRASLDPVSGAHMIVGALVSFQYKPRYLLPLFDGVADEIIRSILPK
jgi:AcrR family transcriptional regulator